MAIVKMLDAFFCAYGVFVTNIGARSILLLAIATVASGISFALCIPIPFVLTHLRIIISAAIVYLACVANYIFRYRRPPGLEPEPQPQPQPQVSYPYLRTFSKSAFPVAALAFFTACDDPLKSIRSVYVPAICVCSYLHVLVLLAILRRKEDFGISDGCLAAAYGLLSSMYDSIFVRFILIAAAIVFTGMRNLQFHSPPTPILLNSIKVDSISNKKKKKEMKKEHSIAKDQVKEGSHKRRGSV